MVTTDKGWPEAHEIFEVYEAVSEWPEYARKELAILLMSSTLGLIAVKELSKQIVVSAKKQDQLAREFQEQMLKEEN